MLHLCHGFNCVFHFNRFLFFLFIVLLFNWFFQYCDVVGNFFSFVIFACSLSILPCQLSSIDRFIFINHVLRWIDTPCEHTYYIKNGINTFFASEHFFPNSLSVMLFHVFFYFIHIFRLYSTLWAHLGTEIDGMVPIANTSFARKFISQMLTLIFDHLFQYVFVFWAFNHFFSSKEITPFSSFPVWN